MPSDVSPEGAERKQPGPALTVAGTDAHTVPSEEHNTVHDTPLPEDQQPRTPEFVAELVEQIDSVMQERSKIFAERYSFQPKGPSDKPGYKKILQHRKEDLALRQREDSLRAELNKVVMLVNADEEED